MSKVILIVEDDKELNNKISTTLRNEGYKTVQTVSGADALDKFKSAPPAAVLMGGTLPDGDGIALLRKFRAIRLTPIIVMGEKASEMEQLMAFAAGADDYMAKPFSTRLLLARLTAVLRRQIAEPVALTQFEVGPLTLDVEARSLKVHKEQVELTRIEFDLLATLIENPRKVVPRDIMIERVWGYQTRGDSIIESHLSRLRAKVRQAGGPMIAVSSRGVGYKLGI